MARATSRTKKSAKKKSTKKKSAKKKSTKKKSTKKKSTKKQSTKKQSTKKQSTKKKSTKKKSTKKKSTKKKSTKKQSAKKKSTKKKSTKKKSTKKKSTKKSPASSVVGWIRALPPPKRALVDAARKLVRAAVPGVDEAIKWGQPVFSGKGPFCYIMARGRDHVTLGFWDGVHLPDPKARLQGEGGRMRHVKIFERGDLDNAVRQLVQRAAARDAKRKG